MVGGFAVFQLAYLVFVRWPALTVVRLVYRLLLRLSLPDHQRAEHLADALGARCVGTPSAISALDAMLLCPISYERLEHAFTARTAEDPWAAHARPARRGAGG